MVLDRTPADVSVTPVGSVPVSVNVGAGEPVAANLNEPAVPLVNEVVAALVMTGAELSIVRDSSTCKLIATFVGRLRRRRGVRSFPNCERQNRWNNSVRIRFIVVSRKSGAGFTLFKSA